MLLAEVNIPSKLVREMEDVNGKFADTDVVLVIGANDIGVYLYLIKNNYILYNKY